MKSYPLALFEEYMLLDDTAAYPMDPILTLRFRGLLDRQIARQAFEDALKRHPLLRSRVEKRGGKFYWTEPDAGLDTVFIDVDQQPDAVNSSGYPEMAPLDLFAAPGYRGFMVESKKGNWTNVILQFHHAVADGLGMMRFTSDFLFFYSQRLGTLPEGAEPIKIDDRGFAGRGKVGWSLSSYLKNYFHTWRTTRQYLWFGPRPLVPENKRIAEPVDARPRMTPLVLSQQETTAYVRRCKALGATVNDMLLTDFYLAMDEWLREVKKDEQNGVLRVMAPVSMRTEETADLSCSNVVSTVFLDRRRSELRGSREETLRSIAEEMNWVKKQDQKYVFLLVLRVLRFAPGSLKFFLRLPTCRSTSVFSNLGRILPNLPVQKDDEGRYKLGDAVLLQVDGKTPLRRKTNLSVVAATYAGELNLSVCCDAPFISEEESDAFCEIFRRKLLENVAG